MAQKYVKDLSKLTGISVQTLHHYDRIGLLKPSVRLPNGYRVYSEQDLSKLQQILALKFFGFELAQIKSLLNGENDLNELLSQQADNLRHKAGGLMAASEMLEKILSDSNHDKSRTWATMIKSIEEYRMKQQQEQAWVGKDLTPEELNWVGHVLTHEEFKQFEAFESGLKDRFTLDEKEEFNKNWMKLVATIELHLNDDPNSDFGKNIGKEVMALINYLYGKEHANLRHAIWEKGYKQNKVKGEHHLSPEVVAWMDQAVDVYYRDRIYSTLNKFTENPSAKIVNEWNALLDEMCGNSPDLKQDVLDAAQTDERVNAVAKKWLRNLK